MTKYKEILKYRKLSYSQRQISDILSVSRNTIKKVYVAADTIDLQWSDVFSLSEDELSEKLFPTKERESLQEKPDLDYIHQELQKKGVTLSLLWQEYVATCKCRNVMYLQYAQYCVYYRKFKQQYQATMHFDHQPAQRIEVDWAGTTIPIYDVSGEVRKAYLFVATLPYSQYSYVEVTDNMKSENWIQAHVNMFHFFGGSTPMIFPDNLKTGIISHPKHDDIVLNKAYEEMANYYNTVIIPALPRTPKGKPSVEGTVGKVTTQLIAYFRNHHFESVAEANQLFRIKLNTFNNEPFQKREGSRHSVFQSDEKNTLQPLPCDMYEYAIWKSATVAFNYHIAILKNNYSVPYQYIKCKVEARISAKTVEIYHKGSRICSHSRIPDGLYRYSTNENHMPEKHQKALEWNGERFRNWARKIGPQTYKVIHRLLESYKIEQQGYKGCNSLLQLNKLYSIEELEQACQQALQYIKSPRYKDIKLILETRQPLNDLDKQDTNKGAYIRGAAYFGGQNNES